MKNIHILTTSKPSRLLRGLEGIRLFKNEISPDNQWCVNVNISITSDEEIKEGEPRINNYQRKLKGEEIPSKKIILTTDQDLIQDGVQAIDDEFLEWFVKNPSCEEVEVDKNWNYPLDKSWEYKIIIPKEEPKQETLEEFCIEFVKKHFEDERTYNPSSIITAMKVSAKYQQERSYSEEEIGLLNKMFELYWYENNNEHEDNLEEWELSKRLFEQFKKKKNMGKCYDNPKYDKPHSDIQNTWERTHSIEKPKEETLEEVLLKPKDLIEFAKWIDKMGYSHRLKLVPNDLINFYLKNKENIIKLN